MEAQIRDQSVVDFLSAAKEQGFNIIFYPLIMVDVARKPWRGHMTGKAEDVEAFYQNYYKPFIIHYANLVKDKVDAFIIGSELVGLTRIHATGNIFPFVQKLIELAADVRAIMSSRVKLTYAADWSEYHTSDGTQRPLDSLWASKDIDFVGIDAYFPLTRSTKSRIEIEAIKAGWRGGEGWDYWLDNESSEHSFNGERWNQWKNLEYWWSSEHWVEGDKTPWQPRMKPIWFTEFGFPSIDKAPNKPNVFFDPRSSDGGIPTYSNGKLDYAIQRKALRATLEFWQDSPFLENMICWTWDSRGLNWRNILDDKGNPYYADSHLWEYGHWIDGKIYNKGMVILSGQFNFDTLDIDAYYLSITSLMNPPIYSKKHYGSKSTHRFYDEDINITSIKAHKCNFKIRDKCLIQASVLDIGDVIIQAGSLDMPAMVTKHEHVEIFEGTPDWLTGNYQESIITKKWEIPYPTLINANYAIFEIEDSFIARAVKMNLGEMHLEASRFEFSGMKLANSYNKDGHSKGGLFSPAKHYSNRYQSEEIEGVAINVGGHAFMLASGRIWLAATGIKAQELYIQSPKVELQGLIGSQYYGMKVSKTGFRFALTFNISELSFGPELYTKQSMTAHYKEYAYPSILMGEKILTINTDMLLQTGSLIMAKLGKIRAGQWVAKMLQLLESNEASSLEVSVGLKLGIKNHVSGLINSTMQTGKALQQVADGENRYAAINAGFGAYNTAVNVVGLASGPPISVGGWVSGGASFASSSSTCVTPLMSRASFDQLEAQIDGDIRGELEIDAPKSEVVASHVELSRPSEEVSVESDFTSIGFEIGKTVKGKPMGGVSISHWQQDGQRSMGFGGQYSFRRRRIS